MGINVLSLFDGISCGQIALERAGIKVDNYYASEIDKHAIKVTQHNYPNTIQIGNVIKVHGRYLPKIDLLIGGSPCFMAGTSVITNNGYKNIENIKIGDLVLTHNKRYKTVIKIGTQKSCIYNLKSQGCVETHTTSNHPYYIREMSHKWDNIERTNKRIFSEPKWKNVYNLNKNIDFVGLPIIDIKENPRNLTNEICWLFGRYVADGYYQDSRRKNRKNSFFYKITICVGKHKIEEFENNIKTLKYTKIKERTSYKCCFNSKELLKLLKTIDFGRGAINKKIPQEMLHLPNVLAKSFLDGYISGDGSFNGNKYKATSISKDLCLGLNLLIAKIYNVNSGLHYTKRPKTTKIENRIVNQNDTYSVEFYTEMKKQSNAVVIDGFIWLPIKSIVNTKTINTVYNIEVEGDNSYTANNVVVHNCQGFSFAGKQLNFEDPRSKLFFEFARILKETNPKYFLLENVKMKKKSLQVITNILDTEPILINSSLVSAQNRKRLYWTNIPNIKQPEDKKIVWGNIREYGINAENFYYTERAMQWLARHSQRKNKILTVHEYFDKMQMLEASHSKKYSSQRFFGIIDLPENKQAVAAMRGRYLINGKRQDGKQLTAGLTKQYVEFRYDRKTNALTTVTKDNIIVPFTLPNRIPVTDFFFRYITPLECERLQNVPDNYTSIVSNTQRYKMLGNGWTIDVIAHILKGVKE